MIRFSLHCDKAHEFEIWFGSNADFDNQRQRGLVECPLCGSNRIEKSLMAPAIAKTGAVKGDPSPPPANAAEADAGSMPGHQRTETALALDPQRAEMIRAIREMVRQVRAGSEDVGNRFPDEARKIHHGEAEKRGIIGQASIQEARDLIEEGIGITPLPNLPEDLN